MFCLPLFSFWQCRYFDSSSSRVQGLWREALCSSYRALSTSKVFLPSSGLFQHTLFVFAFLQFEYETSKCRFPGVFVMLGIFRASYTCGFIFVINFTLTLKYLFCSIIFLCLWVFQLDIRYIFWNFPIDLGHPHVLF